MASTTFLEAAASRVETDYSGSWFDSYPILTVYATMTLVFGIAVTLVLGLRLIAAWI